MHKIVTMLSSVRTGLEAEIDAVKTSLSTIPLIELQGVNPVNSTSLPSSSILATVDMAKNCDLYILILGDSYGMETTSGKSATELEFEAAIEVDPTKVLVFLKNTKIRDERQAHFIKRVTDYYHGYWRTTFEYSHQLSELVINSFSSWLKDRASMGVRLNNFDHFIRIAKQRLPVQEAEVYYGVSPKLVELEYHFFGGTYVIHFDKRQIYLDFWGCLAELEYQFDRWRKELSGGGVCN